MASDRDMTRRQALETMAVVGMGAALPAWTPGQSQTLPAAGPLEIFTTAEHALVVVLSEHIIPADAHSPGAAAAGVGEFIDRVLAISPEAIVREWRDGLKAVDQRSVELSGTPFLQAAAAQQIVLLTEISHNERNPSAVLDRFFCRIKYATIDAYYTSKIGLEQELERKGDTRLEEFPGCTHPEHR